MLGAYVMLLYGITILLIISSCNNPVSEPTTDFRSDTAYHFSRTLVNASAEYEKYLKTLLRNAKPAFVSSVFGTGMYEASRANAAQIAIVPFHAKVPILLTNNGWTYLRYKGHFGWINSGDLLQARLGMISFTEQKELLDDLLNQPCTFQITIGSATESITNARNKPFDRRVSKMQVGDSTNDFEALETIAYNDSVFQILMGRLNNLNVVSNAVLLRKSLKVGMREDQLVDILGNPTYETGFGDGFYLYGDVTDDSHFLERGLKFTIQGSLVVRIFYQIERCRAY